MEFTGTGPVLGPKPLLYAVCTFHSLIRGPSGCSRGPSASFWVCSPWRRQSPGCAEWSLLWIDRNPHSFAEKDKTRNIVWTLPHQQKNTETRRILQGGKNSMLSCFSTSGFEASTSKAYFLAEETLTRQPADLFQSRSASGAVPKKSHYRKDSSCSLDRIVQMVPQCLCKNISTHIWKPIQNFVAATETSLKSPSFTSPSKWVWGGTVSVNIEGLADSSGWFLGQKKAEKASRKCNERMTSWWPGCCYKFGLLIAETWSESATNTSTLSESDFMSSLFCIWQLGWGCRIAMFSSTGIKWDAIWADRFVDDAGKACE